MWLGESDRWQPFRLPAGLPASAMNPEMQTARRGCSAPPELQAADALDNTLSDHWELRRTRTLPPNDRQFHRQPDCLNRVPNWHLCVRTAAGPLAIVIPARPGTAPTRRDADLLAIALVRHLLGRREARFLAEVARDWAHLFARPLHQSEARRIRWLWGAFEQLRAMLAARLPDDDCQQVDTTALPVKDTSRVRGPDGWTGPGNDLAAGSAATPRTPSGSTASGCHQDRPRLPGHPGLEYRGRRSQRARDRRRPARHRAATP
jgi:hypothetical protein